MAWNTSNRNNGKKKGKKRSHEQEVTHTAYLLGCVERGRKNPNSKISSSYEAGKNYAEKTKKPLY